MRLGFPVYSFGSVMIYLKYVDKFGMITTLAGDGGDSAFHMGHYGYLSKIPLLEILDLFNYRGKMRRHPDELKWYGDWDRMYRDQSIPLIICLFKYEMFATCFLIFISHLKRGLLFTTNTRRNGTTKENHGEVYKYDRSGKVVKRNYDWKLPDITGPSFLSIYIRGFNFWLAYPLLCFNDLFLLLKVISFNLKPREPNQLLILLDFSKERLPTPISWLSNLVLDKKKVKYELLEYWYKGYQRGLRARPYFVGKMWLDRLCL